MKAHWLLLIFLLPGVPAGAQAALQVDATERGFFECGVLLSKGAFAYAKLAKEANQESKISGQSAQIRQWALLAPLARRDRDLAREAFAQAVTLMQSLNAPPSALAPVAQAAARLRRPLAPSSDVRPLASLDSDAAYTLSAMDEFAALSAVPENPALRAWLASPGLSHSAQVWYGEGEIAALSQIAAAQQMPDLLPPAEQLATDLRGLRDWLTLRLPDTPSPDQARLQEELDLFLQQAEPEKKRRKASRMPLNPAQLQALGDISLRLQAQILNAPISAMGT